MADGEVEIKVTFNADTGELEGLEDYIRSIRDEAEGTGDAIDSIGMMQAGQALQQYGASAEGLAQQMNQASISVGQLATQTGIAEPHMVSLINNISNATFPNDEAMMYVKSLDQIGVSSENLGQSATDLDKINDAFGMGAGTVNSLGQELSVLGVDMNNVSSSFNALAYANSNTVGGMDNYYTFLRKYDSQFKELGFNVDQASVIIAGATQKFGGGRAALSGLSDALKESNGDTRALEEALGLEAGSIENATQLTGQYEGQLQTLADEEAEHKTLLDQLGAMWEDLSLSISGVTEPIMSFVGLGGQIAGFGTQLNGTWELMNKIKDSGFGEKMSSIKNALSNAGTAAKNAAKNFLTLGKRVLTAGYNALKSAGMWLAQKIQLIATTAWTYLTAAAQAFLNLIMSMNPIMLVVIAIIALIAVLVYLYYNVDSVRQVIDNLGQSIVKTAQWIYNGFMSIVSTIGSALSNAWSTVTRFVGNLVSGLVNGASNAVNGFMNWIRQIPTMVYQEFQRTLQLVSDFISSIPQKVWDMGKAVVDALKSALGIGSPGHMFYMVEGEFKRIDDLTKKTNFVTGAIGQGMVDSFSPSLNSEGVGTSGNNITINIESVDSQERINQIVQAVEDALKFDNLKAGRTV